MMASDQQTIQSKTLIKYKQLNEQLRDFLKIILQLEKSSFLNENNLQSNHIDTNGISLLSTKNDLLYQYLMNLVAVMYHRSQPNHSLNSTLVRSLILRLCEIRTTIEKIRPIEHKLQYQIDKLLKINFDQQLTYRANPSNFDDNDDNNQTTTTTTTKIDQSQVYRPPKIVPVEYNGDLIDNNEQNKLNKRQEYFKRRAYHSDILHDFKMKYSDIPEEIFHTERSRFLQNNHAYQEKLAYEEEYFKRLPQTKHERKQIQRSMLINNNDITSHMSNDINILFDDNFNDISKKKKTKLSRQMKKKIEKKKSKFNKRLKSRT